jgi:cytosine/adenosine deaminase-related metal-dependent hydrolase
MFGIGPAVSLVNGRVLAGDDVVSSIRFRSRILGLGDRPGRGDVVVDLDGAFVVPGLINAHDHLELNHYGPMKRRDRYANASEWIDDLRPIVREDPDVRRNAALPLADRLFFGGLKNLLAGTTTVAHHNPLYNGIARHTPVRVVQRFGWAHSFGLEREPVGANGEPGGDVRMRCDDTPSTHPFIVHAAEGVDAAAADEIARLHALGCVRPNTVIVHGVALTRPTWTATRAAGASLVWCPASNTFLFGRTIPIGDVLADGAASDRICLGSDSRLTGSRDLLDEMRVASRFASPRVLLRMVTTAAAGILRLREAGELRLNAPADLVVVPSTRRDAADAVAAASRAELALVALGGQPTIAAAAFAPLFEARGNGHRPLTVDGVARLADAALARRLTACAIQEPGVACA